VLRVLEPLERDRVVRARDDDDEGFAVRARSSVSARRGGWMAGSMGGLYGWRLYCRRLGEGWEEFAAYIHAYIHTRFYNSLILINNKHMNNK